jgi:hypothetical protein
MTWLVPIRGLFFFVEVRIFWYLNKYIFFLNILERDAMKILHVVGNEDCESLFWMSHGVFIAYESCFSIKRKVWSVILSL